MVTRGWDRVTGEANAAMDQVPDVMLSQDIVTAESAEFVNIRAINPVTVTDST